ncbi:DUF4845 domain-containing protein [Pontibacterium granulatum]|uniref:DUF4845 domain-containing protein n=1 Tax=Pontibacterium granulatum TaxID=2036029 RepID=UPI00249A2F01|nr:DUF4845 domain-containing protein [Pontibacterium granulatum]MDI3323106.1 DUF4845 domain-containing protein [Pontibacterium granulatum]
MSKMRNRQTGASLLSIMIILIIGGVFFSVGFKLYPAYFDYKLVDSVLTDVSTDQGELSKPLMRLRQDVQKKLRINQVKLPEKDSLVIRQERGILYFDLDYEVRVPMFFNVDAVVSFNKQYEAVKP